MTFKPGDRVHCKLWEPGCRCDPREFDAVVHFIDAEGKPLALMLDGMIEGFAGWLPLIWRDGSARTFQGTVVEIERPD